MIYAEETRLWLEGASIRDARRRARSAQAADPLAQRMRLVTGWRSSPWPKPAALVWPLYHQPGFRWTLMPGVRSLLTEREAARKAQYAAELSEKSKRWAHEKALRKAEPLPLFQGAANA